ncbi:serine carboxypeptidase-like [Tripterygium wilfordii]|uniref:serine carboxypeptidase-like n=1 Tax=Tripterygium wilfordii TaxID=458696 RepID=UPI0018F7F35E|nr:serine carboxypeptidase-like [Tripterygium wilfordii]
MAASNAHIFLFFLLLSRLFTLMLVQANRVHSSKPVISPRKQAVELIQEVEPLKIFPKDEINNIVDDQEPLVVNTSRLVEKQFNFPFLGVRPATRDLEHYAGYYHLPDATGARMFYFFFKSNGSENDPVVLWLTGGPGCSSSIALFYENGPFQITKNLFLEWSNHGWNQVSNILFVDQPIGTGFSYTPDNSNIRRNLIDVTNDLYNFLQEFFKKHHQFKDNEFFITGESHAGYYIPAIASRINEENKAKANSRIYIKLKGLAIGNGFTNPEIQFRAQLDYAVEKELITANSSNYTHIDAIVSKCESSIKDCVNNGGKDDCRTALSHCNSIIPEISRIADNRNYYDIRKTCIGSGQCYEFSKLERFMNLISVKKALGVEEHIKFAACNPIVYSAMEAEMMKHIEAKIPGLLNDGIRLLVYVGDQDLVCNWLGTSLWVDAMEWNGKIPFEKAPKTSFIVDGSIAGELKVTEPLSLLKVYQAGHMVPMDQPKVALDMIGRWMQNTLSTHH